jgi:hypothetical protein
MLVQHREVDEYLDAAPEPQRSTLRKLRALFASILPDAEEGCRTVFRRSKSAVKPLPATRMPRDTAATFPIPVR